MSELELAPEAATYVKKPVEVQAMHFDGDNGALHAVYQWIERNTQGSFDPLGDEFPGSGVSIDPATGFMLIATLEGVMQAKPGDYVIRGIQGEFYPCRQDIFEASYERKVDFEFAVSWTGRLHYFDPAEHRGATEVHKRTVCGQYADTLTEDGLVRRGHKAGRRGRSLPLCRSCAKKVRA